jgi:hypothetical protein
VQEIVEYRDWIGWVVPIWLVAALAAALRGVPILGFSIVGALAGFVLVSVAPPLGRDAEQFGPNLAVGLTGGAVVGALIGAVHRSGSAATAQRRRRRSKVSVVGIAIVSGVTGLLLLGFGVALVREFPPDVDPVTLGAGLVGGGLGWLTGTLVGWRATRDGDPPNSRERWLLFSAVLPIAIMGALAASSVRDATFGPMMDGVGPRHPLLARLEAFVWIDTAIGIVTVVAVALRRAPRHVPLRFRSGA